MYYLNAVPNESPWTKMAEYAGKEDASDAKPTSQMPVPVPDWFEVHCEDGRKYYCNDRAEATSRTVPSEVAVLKQQVRVNARLLHPLIPPFPPRPSRMPELVTPWVAIDKAKAHGSAPKGGV